jgi:hypothetical protein
VLIAVVDEDRIPRGTEDQLFAPFQRLGDHDTSIGVGLPVAARRGWVAPSQHRHPRRRATVETEFATPKDGRHDPAEDQALVIDDEPQILRALRINLSVRATKCHRGHRCRGLQAAADHRPDVIVLTRAAAVGYRGAGRAWDGSRRR